MNVPQSELPRIIVIGSGFAGLRFCKKIDTSRYQVVLIDKNNFHTFQPLLYQVASSGLEPDSIVYPIRKIFTGKKNFYFRMAETERIDSDQKTIYTSIGEFTYDYLVIATGATSNYFGMKNMEKYSMPMKSVVEALDLRSLIIQNFETALNTSDEEAKRSLLNFVIVGAGPTGIELAGALAELRSHVLPEDYPDLDFKMMEIHILEGADRVLPSMSPESSKKSKKYLEKLGVEVHLNTMVSDYDGTTVTMNSGQMKCVTLVWAAGIKGISPNGLNAEKTRGERIITDEFNGVLNNPGIYAIGDIAQIKSEAYPNGNPMLASVAEQQGGFLAKNFNRMAKGKQMEPFVYFDKGTMATIGRNKAVVDLAFIKFGGLFGWLTWMFVHLMLLVDFRNRIVVFANWVWSYLFYDKGTRLIIRKFVPKK